MTTRRLAVKGPKVVLIGAGSVFFGRQTIWSMVSKPALATGTLALVDTNRELLGTMEKIARRAIKAKGVPLRLEVSPDRRKVLKGADFVILAFAVEGVTLRGLDAQVSGKHGITMCSADTIGPGGIFRTLREVPRTLDVLADVDRFCPEAWVINWVNPTTAMGVCAFRYAPHIKSLAICDGPHNPHFDNRLMRRAGLLPRGEAPSDELTENVLIRAGGINHFNWLTAMSYRGRDLMVAVRDSYVREAEEASDEPARTIARMVVRLTDSVGAIPMCIHHTREYVPFFQGRGVDKRDALKIATWDVNVRRARMRANWKDMRSIASGERPMADFLLRTGPDHASDIVESMWAGLGKRFYINNPTGGAVTNMQPDAFLELLSEVSLNEVRTLPYGFMPRPLLGMFQRVLDEHELAVEAAVTGDRQTLLKAFVASPLTHSLEDAENLIEELLRRERRYLPGYWYPRRPSRTSRQGAAGKKSR
jgi:alpha-galactosidase/6-phospho-beta-glucosidase family protein